jgi:DNA-binding response OmpR family regulator
MKRILVVDDDHRLAGLLAFGLRRRGYAVELAADGSQALERVRRGRFDLVLVDWHMPVMDGAAFLRAARAAGTSTPPVVVMSGAPEAAARALELGAAAVLAKPFYLTELQALLVSLTQAPEGRVGCQR